MKNDYLLPAAQSTTQIMWSVIIALLPGMMGLIGVYGWGTLVQIALAVPTALLSELLCLKWRGRQSAFRTCYDGSAILTAILLAMSAPPLAPYWVVILGTAVAIIIAKQLYGGLGNNLFNPAMVAYLVLLISFPLQMSLWSTPYGLGINVNGFLTAGKFIFSSHEAWLSLVSQTDGITQPTPLDVAYRGSINATFSETRVQHHAVVLLFFLGGLFLCFKKVIPVSIPVAMVGTLLCCSFLGWYVTPKLHMTPWFHLTQGAVILGAFFIATDPVTAPTSSLGRWIFGALIGALTYGIRQFGHYPDGVAFAVLLANMVTPCIDRWCQPLPYGHTND